MCFGTWGENKYFFRRILYALLTGVFKQINFMGLGVQIDVYAEHMTNMQLGIFWCAASCQWGGILAAGTACLPAVFFRAMNL